MNSDRRQGCICQALYLWGRVDVWRRVRPPSIPSLYLPLCIQIFVLFEDILIEFYLIGVFFWWDVEIEVNSLVMHSQDGVFNFFCSLLVPRISSFIGMFGARLVEHDHFWIALRGRLNFGLHLSKTSQFIISHSRVIIDSCNRNILVSNSNYSIHLISSLTYISLHVEIGDVRVCDQRVGFLGWGS